LQTNFITKKPHGQKRENSESCQNRDLSLVLNGVLAINLPYLITQCPCKLRTCQLFCSREYLV